MTGGHSSQCSPSRINKLDCRCIPNFSQLQLLRTNESFPRHVPLPSLRDWPQQGTRRSLGTPVEVI
jgi:hypothetical protein